MSTERIDQLVQQVGSLHDPNARKMALDLVRAIVEFHGAGLGRLMEIVSVADPDGALREVMGEDELVSSILLLHDLHPLSLQERVQRVLEQPGFHSRGAEVELLSTDDGIIRVRAKGGPGLKAALEKALSGAAPDAAGVFVEGAGEGAPAADFVPVAQLLAT